jgi:hypothetical protein
LLVALTKNPAYRVPHRMMNAVRQEGADEGRTQQSPVRPVRGAIIIDKIVHHGHEEMSIDDPEEAIGIVEPPGKSFIMGIIKL